MKRRALTALAIYYALTGIWPIVHMASFEAVTGPKVDRWLVKMVGALALANGGALACGLAQAEVSRETIALGISSATAFAAIDVVYALRGRIRSVYLADAAVEIALAAMLLAPERGG